ncbi:hypothetical protein [Yimella sp. cx-51]|uniref:hypothetical protein n=1 Tax=Yimella sp. cx-51 TaxID=2770551 RepID=UPI00165DD294|nr:hypothetical protein [Yimella sp. cx-51]MBC9958343.1 hypothetical protein [Yimella sp. cx-51]QTH39762.1 hypothetical protein J5M86_15220 [Yimella sp. cx-51]
MHHAMQGPAGLDHTVEHTTVDVPIPLTVGEYQLVQRWVDDDPVTYSYEDDRIEDGRHRLWLTRPYTQGSPVPMVSSNLHQLRSCLVNDPPGMRESGIERLEEAERWWSSEAADQHRRENMRHRRMLAMAYLALTDPTPIPRRWLKEYAGDERATLAALGELHQAGRTDRTLLQDELCWAWRYCPDGRGIGRDVAISMFRTLADGDGFTVAGQPAHRPERPLQLWRGATAINRTGVSWTSNPEIAQHFAHTRQSPGQVGHVWTAHIPPGRMLAYLPDEHEFIVDLAGMESLVHEAPAAQSRKISWSTRRAVKRLTRVAAKRRR